MAISAENEHLANVYLNMVDESNLTPSEKDSWIDYIQKAKSATNGFKPEEKIQVMAELQLRMVGRMLQDRDDSVLSRKRIADSLNELDKSTKKDIDSLRTSLTTSIEEVKKNQVEIRNFNQETRQILQKIDERLCKNDKETYKLVGQNSVKGKEEPNKHRFHWFLINLLDLLKESRWAICVMIGFIMTSLILKPELAELFSHLVDLMFGVE